MPSHFAWVDFAEEDKRRMNDVIQMFKEEESRDELGVGVVRDALADLLFPGTSTVQTRARYFLFVPWLYLRHHEKGTSAREVARKARADELKLIRPLSSNDDRKGAIGAVAGETLERLPSSIYWAGLGTWQILRLRISQQGYHRAFDGLSRLGEAERDEDGDPVTGRALSVWDPELPPPPEDFPEKAEFALRRSEATYLQQRILSLPRPSLLAHLVAETSVVDEVAAPWLHPDLASFPKEFQDQLEHARKFSEVMHGAALLYNLMLAEKRGHVEWIGYYRAEFEAWAAGQSKAAARFRAWDRLAFWALPEKVQARVGQRTRGFVDSWVDLVVAAGDEPARLAHDSAARALIHDREARLKGPKSRLENARALERWNGAAGTARANYRWNRASDIVNDILRGLKRKG